MRKKERKKERKKDRKNQDGCQKRGRVRASACAKKTIAFFKCISVSG